MKAAQRLHTTTTLVSRWTQIVAANASSTGLRGLVSGRSKMSKKFSGVNDERGLVVDRKKAVKRWCDRSEEISKDSRLPIPQLPPTYGPIQPITVEETMTALERMNPDKATGPDDAAAELW
ncbi:hypothetical protein Y032_0417g1091 [Ancylostoma ceylanicum]|uniref:Uncharacterized protein n=1 Tax=Ancylostoma ceylanicum TaxID=53326 RepID=A0A016X1F2_9BILA|nr:hypothetical protein Y032_0417g1091 [Ancylostoma ceylanicum]